MDQEMAARVQPGGSSSARRAFLRSLGGGFGALACNALASRWQGFGSLASGGAYGSPIEGLDPMNPMRVRKGDFAAKAKSVIFLFMVGGPSQIDTFDYKPQLQKLDGKGVPESLRRALEGTKHANVFHGCDDHLLASPFGFQQYGQSGMWVSELMPHTAKVVDELCFVHSMQADSNNHAPASYQLHTGDIRAGKASSGERR